MLAGEDHDFAAAEGPLGPAPQCRVIRCPARFGQLAEVGAQ